MDVATHRSSPPEHSSLTQAWLGVIAAFGVALVAGYETIAISAPSIGVAAALPLALVAFVVVGGASLALAARFDAGR